MNQFYSSGWGFEYLCASFVIAGYIFSWSIWMSNLKDGVAVYAGFFFEISFFGSWVLCLGTALFGWLAGNFSVWYCRQWRALTTTTSSSTTSTQQPVVQIMNGSRGSHDDDDDELMNGDYHNNINCLHDDAHDSIHNGGTLHRHFDGFFPYMFETGLSLVQYLLPTKVEFRLDVAKKILPLSFIYATMIVFHLVLLGRWQINKQSKYNLRGVGMVEYLLTIIWTVVLSQKILGQKRYSYGIYFCLALLLSGFSICYIIDVPFYFEDDTKDFSLLAFLVSSLFFSLNSVYTKKLLPLVDNDPWKFIFYKNVIACLLLTPFALYERDHLRINQYRSNSHSYISAEETIIPLMMVVIWVLRFGFIGLHVNGVKVFLIKLTSPVTDMIVDAATTAVSYLYCRWRYGYFIEWYQYLDVYFILFACFTYSLVKIKENHYNSLRHKLHEKQHNQHNTYHSVVNGPKAI